MKIGFLGAGVWGFCLASLLSSKGYEVTCWTTKQDLAQKLNETREHPHLQGHFSRGNLKFTTHLEDVLEGIDMLVESVTSAGLRPVFEKVKAIKAIKCPIVLTSKGIEQNTGLILPEVVLEVLGEELRSKIGVISGPSFAQEVIRGLPTAVVASAFEAKETQTICEAFMTPTFRVYPNSDLLGVSFGGALKNIIAIACGMAEGLGLGFSTKATLMTRGLHEIRKLAVAKGGRPETLNGLSGMGDLCLTCGSLISRNYRFGYLLAQGFSPKEAQEKIEMVVEGVYTCVSALQLSSQLNIPMPITETIHQILTENVLPENAVKLLMQRAVKEEHL